ncbi:MAG: lytic transglycosylase domain-containing protein [Oscillospiraceae bacterium]|nr:lytic transglycosylase domain-containing protein [Oscillospiraceae bacterium]
MIATEKKVRKALSLIKITYIIAILAILSIGSYSLIKNMFPKKYSTYVDYFANKYKLDKYLVYSVIKVESNFKETAISNKGAVGLMQIMPETGTWISQKMGMVGYTDDMLVDTETNIKMGSFYLSDLSEEFHGDINLMIAAYNGGRGNVKNWLSDPKYSDDGRNLKSIPFDETSNYLVKIKFTYKIYKFLYDR